MLSPHTDTDIVALHELSRVHAAQLAAHAASRIRIRRPEWLTPHDRASLAAADAVLGDIQTLLVDSRKRGH